MSCPCSYPLLDKRFYKEGMLFFPQDYTEKNTNPRLEVIEKNNKKYMMVVYRNPKGKTSKEYKVNGHLVYAGCASVTNDKCETKSLFYVLHPIEEWNSFHVLK